MFHGILHGGHGSPWNCLVNATAKQVIAEEEIEASAIGMDWIIFIAYTFTC